MRTKGPAFLSGHRASERDSEYDPCPSVGPPANIFPQRMRRGWANPRQSIMGQLEEIKPRPVTHSPVVEIKEGPLPVQAEVLPDHVTAV